MNEYILWTNKKPPRSIWIIRQTIIIPSITQTEHNTHQSISLLPGLISTQYLLINLPFAIIFASSKITQLYQSKLQTLKLIPTISLYPFQNPKHSILQNLNHINYFATMGTTKNWKKYIKITAISILRLNLYLLLQPHRWETNQYRPSIVDKK